MLDELNKQEKKELMYISLILLISSDKAIGKSWVRNTMVPEVLHTMDPDILVDLMHTFPGQCIKIPSIEQMERAAKVIYYYYHTEIKKLSSEEALKLVKISSGTKGPHAVIRSVNTLKKFFKENSFKIPEKLCTTEFLKEMNNELCRDE